MMIIKVTSKAVLECNTTDEPRLGKKEKEVKGGYS